MFRLFVVVAEIVVINFSYFQVSLHAEPLSSFQPKFVSIIQMLRLTTNVCTNFDSKTVGMLNDTIAGRKDTALATPQIFVSFITLKK